MENNQRKSGAVLSYVSIIVNTIIQLLYTPFLVGKLGQSEYGLYSLVASLIGYLTVLDLGFGNAMIVYTSKYRATNDIDSEKKLHGMFRIIFYIIGFITFVIGIILYFNVNNIFGNTMTELELSKMGIMVLILTFNLAITFPFSIYSSIITAYEKFNFQKVITILNTVLKPLLMIPLLYLGFKSITMTIVLTIVNLFVIISNYYYCRNKLNINIKFYGFDKKLFFEIFGYSIFIFLAVVVDKINWSVDEFILGIVSGTVAVSVYAVASQLNSLFINLSTAISGVMLPKMSKMIANNATDDELTGEFIKIGRIQYYIIFLMVSGLFLFGKEFIIFWVGSEYKDAYYISLILITPLSIPLIQNLGLSIMQAKNKFKFRSIITFIMSFANIIISVFLSKHYGAIGAAVGTALTLIICNIIIMNIYYSKVIGLNILEFWKNIIKISFSYIIPVLVIVLLKQFNFISGITSVILYGIIYTLLYFIFIYLFAMNEYEKNIIYNLLIKLKFIKE